MALKCPHCRFDNPETQRFCGECGTQLTAVKDSVVSKTMTFETPREKFGTGFLFAERYRIIKELGKGGMGRVFHARDLILDRDIALKFVESEVHGDDKIRARFLNEARAAAALDHPFICKIYDTGEIEGDVFIAMEFIEGDNLRERVMGKPLPLRDVLQVISEIAEALEKAHGKGIVHRDLKPENIMLTPQGHAKVMDFGIAKIIAPEKTNLSRTLTEVSITKDGTIVGTLAYMSPEQACGDKVDNRSDIYSLGVVLYELLQGYPPFLKPTAAETLRAILKDPPPPLTSVPKKFLSAVNHILQKSLAKDPQERFQDISLFIRETRNLQKEMVTIALPLFRKLSVVIPFIASLVIVLMSILWFVWLKGRLSIKKMPDPVSILVADFQNNTGDTVFEGALEEALCVGLEGAPFINIYKRGDAKKLVNELGAAQLGKFDIDSAQLIARRELIKTVVGGTIEKHGQKYSIRMRAVDPVSSETLSEYSISFKNKSELLGTIDKLAYQIRSDLGDTQKDPAQKHLVETFTTKSIEAMKAYAKAQELQSQAADNEAITAYQTALNKDPDFGRAYSGLALSYFYTGQYDKYRECMQKALARLDRMTDREKYRTRGVDFLMTRNYKKAIEEFSMLTQEFPGDYIGHANLAVAYWGIRDYPLAIKEAQVSVELRPQNAINYLNLAQYSLDIGNFSLAEESAKKALELSPKLAETYKYLGRAQIATGRFEEADKTWQKCVTLNEKLADTTDHNRLSQALYESRLNDAKKILEKQIISHLSAKQPYSTTLAAQARLHLAGVLMKQGRQTSAVQMLDRAMPHLNEYELYDVAQIYLQAHQNNRAASAAQKMKKSPDSTQRAMAKLIEAEIEIDSGKNKQAELDLDESIKLLEDAKSSDDRWEYRYLLGCAYLKKRAYAEAHSEFELCLKRRGEMFDLFGLFGSDEKIPLVYYYLAQVQEGLNSPAAAASYQHFLDIKRRNDGDLTVKEAKRRLESLSLKKYT